MSKNKLLALLFLALSSFGSLAYLYAPTTEVTSTRDYAVVTFIGEVTYKQPVSVKKGITLYSVIDKFGIKGTSSYSLIEVKDGTKWTPIKIDQYIIKDDSHFRAVKIAA